MRSRQGTVWASVMVGAVVVGTVVGTFTVPARNNPARGQQQDFSMAEFESQFPVTDVNKSEPADPDERARRRAKGKKYYSGMPITDSGNRITVSSEWDVYLPALPVSESDLILIGEVVDAQAYLSDDKTVVYSEFTVRVGEVLKNTSGGALAEGGSITADRQGGRVRFPSGRMTLQYVRGQGLPRVGRRYALFLTHDDQERGARIVTGYELRDGRVIPLDNPAGGRHPIATAYKDADETVLLHDLRAAIAR